MVGLCEKCVQVLIFFFFSSRRRHTRCSRDWSSDVCSSDLIARTSIVRYKGTKENVAQIGQELGVGYLLEGSVRRGGDRVRVTAQLIQAGEQTHLWAETYEIGRASCRERG